MVVFFILLSLYRIIESPFKRSSSMFALDQMSLTETEEEQKRATGKISMLKLCILPSLVPSRSSRRTERPVEFCEFSTTTSGAFGARRLLYHDVMAVMVYPKTVAYTAPEHARAPFQHKRQPLNHQAEWPLQHLSSTMLSCLPIRCTNSFRFNWSLRIVIGPNWSFSLRWCVCSQSKE